MQIIQICWQFIFNLSFTLMTENRLSQLETTIDFLKEKVTKIKIKIKNNEFSRSQLENRMTIIENKIVVLSTISNKTQKQNLSNFDVHLSSSPIFASNLKKVDNNATSNLRKLEDHFGQLLQQSYSKFSQVQEKMLGMFTQKEKIIRNMNFQIENQSHSINAIEEWIRTDHQQVNSLHIVQENLRQRVEMIQKNHDIKVQIIEQKLKYLQQFKEGVQGQMKNVASQRQEDEDEIKNLKKLIKKDIQAVEERLLLQLKPGKDENLSKIREQLSKTHDELQDLKRKQIRQTDRISQLENELTKLTKNMLSFENENEKKVTREPQKKFKQERANSSHERIDQSSSYSDRKKYQSNQFNKQTTQPKIETKKIGLEASKSAKKELPPRKGLLHESSSQEEELGFSPPPDMRGGVRGLLQRSKEKERVSNKESQIGSKKGLPPVRDDPLSRKKKNESQKVKEGEEQEVVYQIDEEGYLLDEDGNYLQDQYGNMIKLSPEEIQQYVTEE